MKTKNLIIGGMIIAAIALCVIGWFAFFGHDPSITGQAIAAVPITEPQVDMEKVKIGYLPVVHGLPLYVAIEKGYFTEQGIAIEQVPFQAPNQIIDALLQGQLDMGSPSTAAGVTAVAESKNPGK